MSIPKNFERVLVQGVLDMAEDEPMVFLEILARRALTSEATFKNMMECMREFIELQEEQLAGLEALADLKRIMSKTKQ